MGFKRWWQQWRRRRDIRRAWLHQSSFGPGNMAYKNMLSIDGGLCPRCGTPLKDYEDMTCVGSRCPRCDYTLLTTNTKHMKPGG